MPFGFLSLGLIWGFGVGYFLADWSSKSIGHVWYANPYADYFDYTVRCFMIGPAVGLAVGLIVDMSIRNDHLRKRLLECNLIALVAAAVLYAIMSPEMMMVR